MQHYSVVQMNCKRLLALYSIHQSLHWFATGLLVPVIALLQLEKGLDLFQIGLTVAVYSATVMALELPTGGLADNIGRKRVYLFSLVVKTVAIGVVLFAQSFLPVLLGFLILAVIGVFIPMGLGLGSIVGGVLPDTLGPLLAPNSYLDIYSSNLLAMAVLVVIQMLFTLLAIKDHHVAETDNEGISGFRRLSRILGASITYGVKNRVVLLLLISSAALGVALSGLENFWQPQLKGITGATSRTWLFGVLAAGYFMAASIGNLAVTPICRLFGNRYAVILFASRICMGAIWFVLAMQTTVRGFAAFYIVIFLFHGISTSPHAAILNRKIPNTKRSTLLSFESLILQSGAVVGSIFLGFVSKVRSISVAWCIGSAILLISSVFYLFIPKAGSPDIAEQ